MPAAPAMLPNEQKKPTLVNTGMAVEPDVIERLDEIVKAERVKSRNRLVGSFLKFAVDLFPHMRLLEADLAEVERETGANRVDTIVMLLRRGIATYQREKKPKK